MRNGIHSVVISLFALLIGACSSGSDVEDSSAHYLSQAKIYLADAAVPEAIIELKNTLQRDADSAEARWLLARAYLESGAILAAEKELGLAVELGWNADDLRPLQAQMLLALHRYSEVRDLEYQTLGASAAALVVANQALAAMAEGELDGAIELQALAQHYDAQSSEVKLLDAQVLFYQGEAAAALEALDALVDGAPEFVRAWQLMGHILTQQGQLVQARAAFDRAIGLSDFHFEDLLNRALINVQLQDYAAAQVDAEELLRLSPLHPASNYVQGLLDFQDQRYRDAIKTLSLAEPAASLYPLSLYYLGLTHLIEKNQQMAEPLARQFVQLQPNDVRGRKLLALIWLQQGKAGDVQSVLAPVLEYNPLDVDALQIMANALLLDDQADRGLVLFARITQLNPGITTADLQQPMLAEDASSELLQNTLDNNPQFHQKEILQILSLVEQADIDGAIAVAQSLKWGNRSSLAPFHLLGRLYYMAGDVGRSKESFSKALEREPGDPISSLGLAQLALARNDVAAARAYCLDGLQKHPNHLGILMQLVAIAERENATATVLSRLDEIQDKHPTALEPRLVRARYFLRSGEPREVAGLFDKLAPLQQMSPGVLEVTALAQLAQRQNGAALLTLERLLVSPSATVQHHILLADAALATGDKQKAQETLEDARRLHPKHLSPVLALARMAEAEGASARFETLLAEAVAMAPQDSRVLSLQAVAADNSGDSDAALDYARRAFAAAPASQTLRGLAGLLIKGDATSEALAAMRDWLKDNPTDVPVRLMLADHLDALKKSPGAQAQYKAVLKHQPDNILALNNLAWLQRKRNPARALETIRRAAVIAPGQPDVLDTMAVIEHLNGHTELAYQTIQRALAVAPGSRLAQYHGAMLEAALGRTDAAVMTLRSLVRLDEKEFGQRAEAQQLLATLVQ